MTGTDTITVAGESPLALPARPDPDRDLPSESMACPVVCHSGRTIGREWTGVPLRAVVEAAAMPPETTHLLVSAADDYRVCIDVETALSGVLAYEQSGDPIEHDIGTTRLVAPGLGSTRSVVGVERIEPVTLDAEEDPGELERL